MSTASVSILDNGRVIEQTMSFPEIADNDRILARLHVAPFADPWDRAGTIQLQTDDGSNVELLKFITGFGGETYHEQDVTHLRSLLSDRTVDIRGFIDTWVQEAWVVDFEVEIIEDVGVSPSSWGQPVFSTRTWRAEDFESGRQAFIVDIPSGLDEVSLHYLPSGHSINGSSGDEFITRDHRVWIDGTEVLVTRPWRTDCRNFRSANPRSGRWGNTWSSDLSRSGWCPGDDVDPIAIDVTSHLPAGPHTIEYEVKDVRPVGADGAYGYWRASSYLTGKGIPDYGLLGDLNGDGALDAADAAVLFAAWGTGPSEADFNRDGWVDGADASILFASWTGDSKRGVAHIVPEPGGLSLLVFGPLFALRVRRMLDRARTRYVDC